ncbi:MAG: ribonuclease HI family protein [Proteobacteria bacterium]|nr:ribonuclease HI family protein [Pseudomonadota bacterium]
MARTPDSTDLVRAFLLDLSCTLDLARTIKNLDITTESAREILGSLVPAPQSSGSAASSSAVSHSEAYSLVASDATADIDATEVEDGDTATCTAGAPSATGLYTAFVDGASRGNPGLAGAGVFILGPDAKPYKRLKKFLGSATNNVAEYSALIAALESALRFGICRLRVRADSELVVKQVNGLYRVKSPDLKPLYEHVMELAAKFDSFEIAHVRREGNAEADQLANEAIDTRPDLS